MKKVPSQQATAGCAAAHFALGVRGDLTLVQVQTFRSGHSQAQRFTAEGLPLLSQEALQLHTGVSLLEQ
jgi:hypothetical protein